MLLNLYVKNLAIIDEVDVEFNEGLNILTGETGAGKSIIIGSINLALGAKLKGDVVRQGCDHALVQLVFSINDEIKEKISKYDINIEDDEIINKIKAITLEDVVTASKKYLLLDEMAFTAVGKVKTKAEYESILESAIKK